LYIRQNTFTTKIAKAPNKAGLKPAPTFFVSFAFFVVNIFFFVLFVCFVVVSVAATPRQVLRG